MTQQDAPEQQALPAAVQVVARKGWQVGQVKYAYGRVIAPPDQTSYDVGRKDGAIADTSLPVDNQTLNQGTAVGTFLAPWNDASGRLYAIGSLATISAADAAVARREGKIDNYVLPAPTISAQTFQAAGSKVVNITVKTDQLCDVIIDYGPTTGYGTTTPRQTCPPGATGIVVTFTAAATGTLHYRTTVTSIWGTTVGSDQTGTVT